MEQPMITVPAEVATDLFDLVGEARRLGNVVADFVNRAEVALERLEGALGSAVCGDDAAFDSAARAAGLGELYNALGSISDTASRI